MSYINHETKGTLLRANGIGDLERRTSDLIFPETTPVSIILIQTQSAQYEGYFFGNVPKKYVGTEVKLLDTYLNTEAGVLFMQEMYVGNDRVLNTAIVRKNEF